MLAPAANGLKSNGPLTGWPILTTVFRTPRGATAPVRGEGAPHIRLPSTGGRVCAAPDAGAGVLRSPPRPGRRAGARGRRQDRLRLARSPQAPSRRAARGRWPPVRCAPRCRQGRCPKSMWRWPDESLCDRQGRPRGYSRRAEPALQRDLPDPGTGGAKGAGRILCHRRMGFLAGIAGQGPRRLQFRRGRDNPARRPVGSRAGWATGGPGRKIRGDSGTSPKGRDRR